jgi:hypothetical protein
MEVEKKLTKHWKVEKPIPPFYSGGSLEFCSDETTLFALFDFKIVIFDFITFDIIDSFSDVSHIDI